MHMKKYLPVVEDTHEHGPEPTRRPTLHGNMSNAAVATKAADIRARRTVHADARLPVQCKMPATRTAATDAAFASPPSTAGARALPDPLRGTMERAFGEDFASVSISEGSHVN